MVPNAENAVVDIRKLRDYCLNTESVRGQHKARLFSSMLGVTSNDAEELREVLLEVVKSCPAEPGESNEYGDRYVLDFMLTWKGKTALVRSGWIVEPGSNIPRLTTCYPLK